jgi:phage terminase large subunit
MSLAIAHYIRPQQDYLTAQERKKRRWTSDMWEDYNNASPREKDELRKLWGDPDMS